MGTWFKTDISALAWGTISRFGNVLSMNVVLQEKIFKIQHSWWYYTPLTLSKGDTPKRGIFSVYMVRLF